MPTSVSRCRPRSISRTRPPRARPTLSGPRRLPGMPCWDLPGRSVACGAAIPHLVWCSQTEVGLRESKPRFFWILLRTTGASTRVTRSASAQICATTVGDVRSRTFRIFGTVTLTLPICPTFRRRLDRSAVRRHMGRLRIDPRLQMRSQGGRQRAARSAGRCRPRHRPLGRRR